jgi:hypothetical protein
MPVKPSSSEEEYFARVEIERRRKLAEERQSKLQAEERERQKALHFMHCPKCGSELEEIPYGDVHVDKCFRCGGLWLDHGEVERILQKKEAGFIGRLLGAFEA